MSFSYTARPSRARVQRGRAGADDAQEEPSFFQPIVRPDDGDSAGAGERQQQQGGPAPASKGQQKKKDPAAQKGAARKAAQGQAR